MKDSAFLPKFLTTWLQSHGAFPQKGDWFPLLLALFLGVYLPLQAFVILALQIWQLEGGLSWDIPLLLAIHNTANPLLDQTATVLTKLGSVKTIAPIALLLGTVLLLQKRWRPLVYLTLTLSGCGAINLAAKSFWHRVRPHLWADQAMRTDFSFPSGHAMTSMAFAAVLVMLAWRSSWRGIVALLAIGYVVVIGWTRLYLGVHYPSDILAGWLLSIACAIGISLFVKPAAAAAAETAAELSSELSENHQTAENQAVENQNNTAENPLEISAEETVE